MGNINSELDFVEDINHENLEEIKLQQQKPP
jgi:hypothetical protein